MTVRVAIFFDGKNFYSGLKDRAPDQIIDFPRMSHWLVQRVGGTHLWGAYYYTGVERPGPTRSESQSKLSGFLDMLDLQPGFFVKRFPRKIVSATCRSCNAENTIMIDKEIDTTIVADMLGLAAVGAYDIAVLLSGDTDLTPAVKGVRAIGKQVFVATWGRAGLSSHLRKSAFDHIDLLDGLEAFGGRRGNYADEEPYPRRPATHYDEDGAPFEEDVEGEDYEDDPYENFIEELKRAEAKFASGYVGMNYFLRRWVSSRLSDDPDERADILDALVEEGRVEIYEAPDGNRAIRCRPEADGNTLPPAESAE